MLALTIGLLRKSCLLRESCLGWEGRLLEAATEAGGETVGSGGAEPSGHAHGRRAKGGRWWERRGLVTHIQRHILFPYSTLQTSLTLKNIKRYIKGILNSKTQKTNQKQKKRIQNTTKLILSFSTI